jgi:hypothetical protein
MVPLISKYKISHKTSEETNAPYIIPRLYKKHYMEAIEELGGRLKCRLTTPRRTPKMKRVDYYLEDIQEALVGPPFKIYVRTTS